LRVFTEALKNLHLEYSDRTRTALAQATAAAAENAATQPPPPVLSTSRLRELTAAASRVFGWDNATPQVTHNQLVITVEQMKHIGMLREGAQTIEQVAETSRRLATPEGQNQLRRVGTMLRERAQNMEHPNLSPAQSAPEICEVTIRGDSGGVRTKQ